jgi:hypothetical protein
MVRNKQLKLLFGTDAASEGLNLQDLVASQPYCVLEKKE